jgi:hypothetical protein
MHLNPLKCNFNVAKLSKFCQGGLDVSQHKSFDAHLGKDLHFREPACSTAQIRTSSLLVS